MQVQVQAGLVMLGILPALRQPALEIELAWENQQRSHGSETRGSWPLLPAALASGLLILSPESCQNVGLGFPELREPSKSAGHIDGTLGLGGRGQAAMPLFRWLVVHFGPSTSPQCHWSILVLGPPCLEANSHSADRNSRSHAPGAKQGAGKPMDPDRP